MRDKSLILLITCTLLAWHDAAGSTPQDPARVSNPNERILRESGWELATRDAGERHQALQTIRNEIALKAEADPESVAFFRVHFAHPLTLAETATLIEATFLYIHELQFQQIDPSTDQI